MKPLVTTNRNDIIPLLQEGKIGVMPTDTLYGLMGNALEPEVVERVYNVKHRHNNKPMIVLLAHVQDVRLFGVNPDSTLQKQLHHFWPGPVSIILPIDAARFTHLHQGSGSLALRVPNDPALQILLEQTGPLVATSANQEAQPPATTISEAKAYFGNTVDFYVDGGAYTVLPSTLIRLNGEEVEVVRPSQKEIR